MRLNPLIAKYFPSERPELGHSEYNESIVPSWNEYDDDVEGCDCDRDDDEYHEDDYWDDEDYWNDEDDEDDSGWF